MDQVNNNLNLARKWRPSNFKELVGQDIPVKMLLNSLYLEKLFPVYLFAGQRGCGKTSAARIFAAAINCKNIKKFRTNPKENIVPCGKCNSCKAMLSSSHPDFIEIDAASNTGVENVRQILEACSYMPILGHKKIYLIDEAHMLSKSAFNAFLKVLEEPPASALFILATTEIQKFPTTVLSRCFQIIFKAINNAPLKKYLSKICNNENIEIEENAINIIVQETEGSARDAINMLEQMRFSDKKITVDLILKQLGKISEGEVLNLLQAIVLQDKKTIFNIFGSKGFENLNPAILWNTLVQALQSLLWVKYEAPKLPAYFNDTEKLKSIASNTSLIKLNQFLKTMWEQENIFLKTSNKTIFIETLIIQMSEETFNKKTKPSLDNISHSTNAVNKSSNLAQQKTKPQVINNTKTVTIQKITSKSTTNSSWQSFLEKINSINNPFLTSVINKADFIKFNPEERVIEIALESNNMFTQSTINDNKELWKTILTELFPGAIGFEFSEKETNPKPVATKNISNQANQTLNATPKARPTYGPQPTQAINISDQEKWPTAHLIQSAFPGKIKANDSNKQ